MNNFRKLRKEKDVVKYLNDKNIQISFYKLKKLFMKGKISGIHLNNNYYFYLDDIDKYFKI